ncbi:MAG: Gfo/Idh/MocA family oxidoreductase [Synergistaceae bacterium]|nr:Gfo/Idh/MocA family oxidoreductase [Synergistaceae bacterium]
MEPVRVGVVGVGHLGHHHARVYTEILGARLVGIVDVDEERAASVGESLGVPSFSDLEDFFDRCRPDAISIVVPTCHHYDVAVKALERKIHVLVEKPVTTTVEQAEKLLRLAEKNGLVLQVGHIERFNSAVQHVRNIVKEPLMLQSRRLGPYSPRIADVGVVLDLMIHDIDIILSLVHAPLRGIVASGRKVLGRHEDIAMAQLSFTDGTLADILVSRVSEKRMRQLEIMERERFVTVDYATQDVSIHRCVQDRSTGLLEVIEHPVFPKGEPLKLELQHLISCVQDGRMPLVSITDGKRALEIAVEVLRQIQPQTAEEEDLKIG